MKVGVTGATGFIGSHIVEHLLTQGHQVYGLCREPKKTGFFRPENRLNWILGDLANQTALEYLLENSEALIHAAFSHQPGRYRGGEGQDAASFLDINLEQTKRLFTLAKEFSVDRVIFISSRAVFDGVSKNGSCINDEETPLPTTLYGEVKYKAEQHAMLLEDIGFSSLRLTGVYSGVHREFPCKWSELIESALKTNATHSSPSNQSRTEVHVSDVANAVEKVMLSANESSSPSFFNCSDISISHQQIDAIVQRIVAEQDPLTEWLPDAIPASNVLKCDNLRQLGWVPSGLSRLLKTLTEVVDSRRSSL